MAAVIRRCSIADQGNSPSYRWSRVVALGLYPPIVLRCWRPPLMGIWENPGKWKIHGFGMELAIPEHRKFDFKINGSGYPRESNNQFYNHTFNFTMI